MGTQHPQLTRLTAHTSHPMEHSEESEVESSFGYIMGIHVALFVVICHEQTE